MALVEGVYFFKKIGEIENENKPKVNLNAFSLVVVRRKSDNKYLLV